MNVEPSLSDLSERVFDNFLKATHPTLFTSVKLDLSDTWTLYLFEFFHSEGLSLDGNIIYAVIL